MTDRANGARRVVVTGLGVVSPLGCDARRMYERLVAGESGVAEITRFDHSDQRVHIAAEVEGFDPEDYLEKRKIRRLDLFSRFAVGAAKGAAADAGFDPRPEAERVGAVIGSGVGGLQTLHLEIEKLLTQGPERTNPLLVPMMIPNMGAAHVSLELGTKGPLSSTCTACAAGSDAIGLAFEILRRGAADAMFAGGSEAPISPVGLAGFAAARTLSRRNDDPTAASRPFDRGRDGFVMGEGAAVMVIETLEHAQARGAKIYGTLAGSGISADSFDMVLPDPSGAGQGAAMTKALRNASLTPADINHVNAHGTSTPQGDITEANSVRTAFGADTDHVVVTSTKSMTGHLLGGAGALETIATVMALHDRMVPPTINLEDPDDGLPIDVAANIARQLPDGDLAALNNSFGFGGANVAVAVTNANQTR